MNFRGYPLDRRPAWPDAGAEARLPDEPARNATARRPSARRARPRLARRGCAVPGS